MSACVFLHTRVYRFLCGEFPRLRSWHFQYLASRGLRTAIISALNSLHAATSLLDAGCGNKPYRAIVGSRGIRYVSLDTLTDTHPDFLVGPNQPWPLPDGSYDHILCTQTLQYISDIPFFLAEIHRVLKPHGTLILSCPFLYNEHACARDFQRFTGAGLENALNRQFDILSVKKLGGAGSVIGQLALNWIDTQVSRSLTGRLLKGILMPVWLILCLLINLVGLFIDHLDSTGCYYLNTLIVARKRA